MQLWIFEWMKLTGIFCSCYEKQWKSDKNVCVFANCQQKGKKATPTFKKTKLSQNFDTISINSHVFDARSAEAFNVCDFLTFIRKENRRKKKLIQKSFVCFPRRFFFLTSRRKRTEFFVKINNSLLSFEKREILLLLFVVAFIIIIMKQTFTRCLRNSRISSSFFEQQEKSFYL